MLSAKLRIRLGKKAKDYLRVMGKGEKFKRGSVSFSADAGAMIIDVKADDAVALIASLGSAVKRLRVVSSVDSVIE